MWSLVPLKMRLTVVAAVVGVFTLIEHVFLPSQRHIFGLDVAIVSEALSAAGLLATGAALLSDRVFFWRWTAWALPLLGVRFPDVSGFWVGWTRSNFVDRRAFEAGQPLPGAQLMGLKLHQTWARVRVDTWDHRGYRASHARGALPFVDPDGIQSIRSVYDGLVAIPESTEDRGHHGSSFMQIHHDAHGHSISGAYFSDRGVRYAQPAAGVFHLIRLDRDPGHAWNEDEARKALTERKVAPPAPPTL